MSRKDRKQQSLTITRDPKRWTITRDPESWDLIHIVEDDHDFGSVELEIPVELLQAWAKAFLPCPTCADGAPLCHPDRA